MVYTGRSARRPTSAARVPLRNMGAAISPFNARQIPRGVETLALRMDRICENTLAVARHLKAHPKVAWVNYAGLKTTPTTPS